MKTAQEWVAEHQCAELPAVGSFVHTLLCEQVQAIQRDALITAADIALQHEVTTAAERCRGSEAITEFKDKLLL